MEAVERSHQHRSRSSSGGAGDFFICFTARFSSTAVASSSSTAKRIPSSKAMMSPGRCREPSSAPALSASLSRRLRSSGSVKGGQSPMFPSGLPISGRKKGCVFEANEPSSPKVTCIGQVRVKAKKKVKARGSSQRGRDCCPGKNQSWVQQLPLSICEALRGFGSEFSCFLPCGGRSGKVKGGMERSMSSRSCGAVVAKWLLTVQESEEEVKGVEKVDVGFLVREREREKVEIEEKGGDGGEEEAARVSVCIPPRNALLLMRCRSDPVKMAAMANRFWGSPKTPCDEDLAEEKDKEVEVEIEKRERNEKVDDEGTDKSIVRMEEDTEMANEEKNTLMEENQQPLKETCIAGEETSCGSPCSLQEKQSEDEPEKKADGRRVMEERRLVAINASRPKEKGRKRGKEKEKRRHSFSSELDTARRSFSSDRETRRSSFSIDRGRRWSFSLEKTDIEGNDHIQSLTFIATTAPLCGEKKELETEEANKEVTISEVKQEAEIEEEKTEGTGKWTELPNCLLMMMYEPKLSMEVSKETWVCGKDFVGWRPSKPDIAAQATETNKPAASEAPAMVVSKQQKQSARPAAVAPYEPLVLTRCKSEPLRSSARLAPDACFWKDRHRPIETAGIGF